MKRLVAGSAISLALISFLAAAGPAVADPTDSVDPVEEVEEVDRLPAKARRRYEREQLNVDDGLVVTSGESHARLELSRGKYRKPIETGDFLRLVGRPEAAELHESRARLQAGLLLGGLTAALLGGVMEVHARSSQTDPAHSAGAPGISRVLFAGGVALGVASLFVKTDVVPPEEMRRLADQYNQDLRRRLRGAASSVRAAPYALPDGGGVVLGGRF